MKLTTKKITHLLATTAVAVVLQFSGGVMSNGSIQGVSQAQASPADVRLMYNRGYGYCDAKKVAAVWNVSVTQAKSVIADKIRNGRIALLGKDIKNSNAFCTWSEVQITYQDAENLARFWGISTNEAKTKAKAFVNDMGRKRFKSWAFKRGVSIS